MPYVPSVFRVNKYGKYLMYLTEYLTRGDVSSIWDSLNYLFFKKLPTEDRVVETEMGFFKLRCFTNDFQFVNWTYEKKIKNYLEENHKKIGLFIDVGACIGEYCIWLGNKGIQCIAIEPVNYDAIEENIIYNTVAEKNVFIVPVAVGKENKNVAFNKLDGVTSSSHINPKKEGNIPCHKLDDIIDLSKIRPDKITFIKLDVEGMELEALAGATSIIAETPNLQIVYEHTSLGDRNIRDFLDKWGKFYYEEIDDVNTLAIKKQP
jgi:FkbM family methyltransferase